MPIHLSPLYSLLVFTSFDVVFSFCLFDSGLEREVSATGLQDVCSSFFLLASASFLDGDNFLFIPLSASPA